MNKKAMIALMGLAAAGIAGAANIDVADDITTSTTWTSDNVYNLTKQIYVRPGASLTIEPGTLVQSTANVGGSLAVSRGAKIYVNGTKDAPVIMTSTLDTLTSWHEGCNEWGNLTLMGNALIGSASYAGVQVGDNTPYPTGLNEAPMEGLTPDGTNSVYYGGDDDNDDSGSIHYLSLRYGGKVESLNKELNGLSMGGIGRETDVDHIDIMNNVDDGIETWGGTVNYKYINIWNIGDDSMDVDQGWRGKAQFGLIVQGYSTDADQGSGVGDNCFETDGAEDSDAQPVTTAKIANFTVVGQVDGDGATTWRDNARVQYHNCIFMDIGEQIVRFDDDDGDGQSGYGYNGTLSWADTWTTPYDTYPTVNWTNTIYSSPADMYPVQTSGYLAEIRGSLFYNCVSKADDQVVAVGVLNGSIGALESKPELDNVVATAMPIQGLSRGPVWTSTGEGKDIEPVTNINPCAANDALSVETPETADGFYTAAPFRGGFSANNNWLAGWTSVDAYGMTDTSMNTDDPAATIQMTASTFFQTEDGVVYTVEESSDMRNWSPVATVTGDGSIMSATDLDTFDSAKFYRAIIL